MSLKKIIFFIIVIGLVLTINNLAHSIYDLWHKKDLVVKAQQEVEKEKQENGELKKKLQIVNDPQFVETEARNKLLLAKPGEGVLVLPTDYLKAKPVLKRVSKDTKPNWKQWLELFTTTP